VRTDAIQPAWPDWREGVEDLPGTATFGVAPDAQEAERVVGAALDAGINFFDTANVYGASPTFDRPGVPPAAEREPAEQILGRALAGRRDDVVLATKSGERRFDPAAGLSRRYVIQQVEHSLRRLGTDYIDLYYAHFPDPDTPLEQTLSAYDDLVRQGKLRYVALSNYPAWQVTHALWIADDRRLTRTGMRPGQVQPRRPHRGARAGPGLRTVRAVHRAVRSAARRTTGRQPGLQQGIRGDERFGGPGFTDTELDIGGTVERLSQEWRLRPYQVSLAWLLSRPAVASAIIGAETVDEITANAIAADVTLEQGQLDALTALGAGDEDS
jgi:1-deoxyxylulose-5-phosphate synthase